MTAATEYRSGVISARPSTTADTVVYTHHHDTACVRLAALDENIVEWNVTAADAEHAAMECDYCHPAGWYDESLRRASDSYDAPDLPRNEHHGTPTGARRAPLNSTERTNRYAGPCARCGGNVPAEGGLLFGSKGAWRVEHRDGECVTVESTPTPGPRPFGPEVPAGHYAITSTGTNDLAFYRVDRPTDGTYAGRTFVKLVVGGHPDSNVRRDAVPGILARIVEAGVVESARLYGTELGQCSRCNRTLTDEESRRLGIGPECRKRSM